MSTTRLRLAKAGGVCCLHRATIRGVPGAHQGCARAATLDVHNGARLAVRSASVSANDARNASKNGSPEGCGRSDKASFAHPGLAKTPSLKSRMAAQSGVGPCGPAFQQFESSEIGIRTSAFVMTQSLTSLHTIGVQCMRQPRSDPAQLEAVFDFAPTPCT